MTTTTLSVEEIQDALSAIVDDAGDRDLTDDEHTQIEALEGDLAEAVARRERTEAVRARNAERKKIVTQPLHVAPAKADDADLNAAFLAYMRTGQENADLQHLRAAQSEGTPTEGGFLVPPALRIKIVEKMKAFGGLAGVVDEVTTDTGNSFFWPTMDDTTNVGEVVDEGGTFVGGADLVFGQDELSAYSYMAGGANGAPLRISRELVQDAAFDIEARVAAALGTRMARIQATHLVTGTGVSQPKGIVTGKTGVQTAANNALTYRDLLGYVHALDPAYRASGNCRWAFNDPALQTIRGLLDGNNRPILKSESDGIGGDPGGYTLLGYPVTIDQGFSNFTNNSPTVNWGVFGDLREAYIVRRVKSIELLVNPYERMSNRQITYCAWARMDALPQNQAAYIAMTGKT